MPSSDKAKRALIRSQGWIRKNLLSHFMKFVHGYENVLQTRFPRTFRVYQVFVIGAKHFYKDVLAFARISRELRSGTKQFKDLSWQEIDLYYKMPKEMWKVAPVLILSALPFTNYVIFPVAYYFPRQLLSSHFWSLQQKVDFALIAHRHKLYSYRPVFRHLQKRLQLIQDEQMRDKCETVFHKIGSGFHPVVSEILDAKDAFSTKPYQLDTLSPKHISGLCRMHGLRSVGIRTRKLWIHAGMLQQMDLALAREKNLDLDMDTDELRRACFLRGLNPVGMQREDMIMYLQQWMEISKSIGENSYSLILHCPILLAYNHPTNWSLIY